MMQSIPKEALAMLKPGTMMPYLTTPIPLLLWLMSFILDCLVGCLQVYSCIKIITSSKAYAQKHHDDTSQDYQTHRCLYSMIKPSWRNINNTTPGLPTLAWVIQPGEWTYNSRKPYVPTKGELILVDGLLSLASSSKARSIMKEPKYPVLVTDITITTSIPSPHHLRLKDIILEKYPLDRTVSPGLMFSNQRPKPNPFSLLVPKTSISLLMQTTSPIRH